MEIVFFYCLCYIFKTGDTIKKVIGDSNFSIKASLSAGDGEITYSSNNESVATVDSEGNVTIVGPGEALLMVNISETDLYAHSIQSVLLRVYKSVDELNNIPDTAKETPYKTIRIVISIFLILLGGCLYYS